MLDVGANIGQYGLELREVGYQEKIISFEPNPDCFEALLQMAQRDGKWECFELALGSESGNSQLNITNSSDFSSFLQPGKATAKYYPEANAVSYVREVEVSTVSEIVPDLKERRLFLKMDTQGYDLEVFKGAADVLDRIHGLQSEVSLQHLYEGMPEWHESVEIYRDAGFELVGMFPLRPGIHNEIVEFNCYFRNSAMRV